MIAPDVEALATEEWHVPFCGSGLREEDFTKRRCVDPADLADWLAAERARVRAETRQEVLGEVARRVHHLRENAEYAERPTAAFRVVRDMAEAGKCP